MAEMAEQESAAERVRRVVAKLAPTRVPTVGSEDRIVEDLGYDSLAVLELVFALEEEFGLHAIGMERALHLTTVGDVEELLDRLTRTGA